MSRSQIEEGQAKDPDFLSEQEFADAHSDTIPPTPDDGTGASGVSADVSRADHKHPEHAFTPTTDQNDAADGANSPSSGNVYATIADIPTVSQIKQVLSTFIPSSPSGAFQIYGDGSLGLKLHTDVTLLDIQFQFQQGNAAQMEMKCQLVKYDAGTTSEIVIFEIDSTTSGSNNDFRSFITSTVENPGEEVIDTAGGDLIHLHLSDLAGTGGMKQVNNLTITFSFDPN